ncbi:hypothetical protein GCM10023069_54750 [Shinella granuli]
MLREAIIRWLRLDERYNRKTFSVSHVCRPMTVDEAKKLLDDMQRIYAQAYDGVFPVAGVQGKGSL